MNNNDPLHVDPEAMRRMGYEVVDFLVDRISTLNEQRAWTGATRDQLETLLHEAPPADAHDFTALLNRLRSDVLAYGVRVDHPRFFAFVPGSFTWPGVLGDTIAAAHQSFAGTWLGGAGVATLELVVLDWFREWLGMPEGASGLLLSGGSIANLTALACARRNLLHDDDANATIYFSGEAHSSLLRAAHTLGVRDDRIRIVDVDRDHRISLDHLRTLLQRDTDAGLRPYFLVGNAGTTSTGAIDDLPELEKIARAHGMWFHVDAAYGGFAVLTERGAKWLEGIGNADSVTLDPHKWLFQPFEAGCLMVRDPQQLRRAFHIMPDYLRDTAVEGREVNFGERGIQLTRAARSIKIWLSLQYFGVDAFRRTIDQTLDLTLEAQRYIEASNSLELLTPARLGIVCFARKDGKSEEKMKELAASGYAMMSSTRIDGQFALRLCILNHATTRADVIEVLRRLEA